MPQQTRQLAAIMFTDIVGYTRLMGHDESQALALLRKNRNLHKSIIKKHNGTWLKEMGDGTLASFKTTSDAVYCAGELMKACVDDSISLRIGIHQGEVTMEDGDIFGDGVNVASRLEPLAEPGQILVSESIHQNVKNREGITSIYQREVQLKNVVDPVRVYHINVTVDAANTGISATSSKSKRKTIIIAAALALLILVIYNLASYMEIEKPDSSGAVLNSIAVLPFEDLSPEKDQEYLGDGISEEIINVLVQIDGLKVIGRTSSFSFKDDKIDLIEIGKKLDVRTILEGSVRKSQDKLRITAQLINTQNGSHIWSETYDKELTDIFVIQDDIAKRVLDKFKLTLKLSKDLEHPTNNIDAYEMYLRGKQSIDKGLVGAEAAVQYLEEAIAIDPNFLKAHSILSEAYWIKGFYGLANPTEDNIKAKNSALKIIKIDPNSYLGYRALSWINFVVEWDWQSTIENYNAAVERGLPLPDQTYSYYQSMLYGKSEESIEGIKELLKDDPLSIDLLMDLSRMYLFARQFEDVIENGNKVLALSPENSSIKRHLGSAYLFSGDYPNAMKYYGELLKKDSTYVPHGYIGALVKTGRTQEAWDLFYQLPNSTTSIKKALCYIHLGALDSAFNYVDKASLERDAYVPFLKVDPHFNLIKDDPRYLSFIKKMNFPVNPG